MKYSLNYGFPVCILYIIQRWPCEKTSVRFNRNCHLYTKSIVPKRYGEYLGIQKACSFIYCYTLSVRKIRATSDRDDYYYSIMCLESVY